MIKAVSLGLIASLFFSLTFVLNHAMQASGGHWVWTASLRFIFMLPLLFMLLLKKSRYKLIIRQIGQNIGPWLLWSSVGFGLFYLPLCVAASYAPSWMIAATWQITIVAGILLTPLFRDSAAMGGSRHKIPKKQLIISLLIVAGVLFAQFARGSLEEIRNNAFVILLILVAAVSYPLGNRKMMSVIPPSFSTIDRVFGMTLCSMPFWLITMLIGLCAGIYPTIGQIQQSFIVAVFSGVIATLLFFRATELVKARVNQLAIVESTQAGEIVFTLILGLLFFGDQAPSWQALLGVGVIIVGIVANGISARNRPLASARPPAPSA